MAILAYVVMKKYYSLVFRYVAYFVAALCIFKCCDALLSDECESYSDDSEAAAKSAIIDTNSYGPEWIDGIWIGKFSMSVLGNVSYFMERLEINQKTGTFKQIDVINNKINEGSYYVEDKVIRAHYPIARGTTIT